MTGKFSIKSSFSKSYFYWCNNNKCNRHWINYKCSK